MFYEMQKKLVEIRLSNDCAEKTQIESANASKHPIHMISRVKKQHRKMFLLHSN